MKALRLQAFLARAGVASRRKAEDLIREGRVRVNGKVAVLGQKVGPEDLVEVDGKRVEAPAERVVLALHKPRGYTTTRHDPHARRTVFDLLPKIPGLHPVGRLDRDSEGLLLFTNDGALTFRLTHPRHGVRKVYRVWTEGGRCPRRCAEGSSWAWTSRTAPPGPSPAARPPGGGPRPRGRAQAGGAADAPEGGLPGAAPPEAPGGAHPPRGPPPGKWRRLSEREVKALLRLVGLE